MAALIKTSLYVGVVLLVGAGLFERFIGPELAGRMRRRLRSGALLGGALVILVSLGDVVWTVSRLLSRFDPSFIWDYALHTNHGRATLVRVGLTFFVAAFVLVPRLPRRLGGALLVLTSLGLLATFSYLSHAAVMHGGAALLADLGHFSAATLWAGAVLYTALSPAWEDDGLNPQLVYAVGRVSSTGLLSVLLLTATGVYASLLHVRSPTALVTSPYGRALLLKLALVGVILSIAAFNRWWLLPAFRAGDAARLGQVLKLEALLLLGVLAATGMLTTHPLPHD